MATCSYLQSELDSVVVFDLQLGFVSVATNQKNNENMKNAFCRRRLRHSHSNDAFEVNKSFPFFMK